MNIKLKLTLQENIDYYQSELIDIEIEEYLLGVVPAEIGNAALEACKAQAIAARTFAFIKHSNGKQLSDKSSTDQAYRVSRVSSKYPNALLAVEETAGQVLFYNNELLLTCPYSSSNGGRIKSSQEKWGGYRPYLISKEDPYDNGNASGHGVGMSQTGAKNMASAGFTYKDILSFYYPGTEIKEGYGMGNAEIVKNWCLSKKGCGYVWGATGQRLTESSLEALYQRHQSEVDKSLCWRLWAGKIVYDCAGFVSEAVRQVGFSITAGATSAWKSTKWAAKGTIDTLPKDKVCCLYRHKSTEPDPNKMQHTGIYLGDGTFMDSRETAKGVLGPNPMSSYGWTHWAIPPQLADETVTSSPTSEVIKVAYQAKVVAATGNTVNMRKSPSTSSGVLTAIQLGQIVDVISTTGDWSQITWNGKSGYMMSKYLLKVDGSDGNKVWYVRIECESEEQANAIAKILGKAQAAS